MKRLGLRYALLLVLLWGNHGVVISQTFNQQSKAFANNMAAYFNGYIHSFYGNVGNAMLSGHQLQHGNQNWTVRYSLSLSGSLLPNTQTGAHNYNSDVTHNQSTSYIGPRNSVYGGEGETQLRHYWTNENGRRLIDPYTGKYVYSDITLPGGLNQRFDLVPSSIPYLEFRFLKGLSGSLGFFPLGYMFRDMEDRGISINSNIWAAGLAVDIGRFTQTPVLKWLRLDAATNRFNVGVANIQNVYNLDLNNSLMLVKVNQLDAKVAVETFQARATLAIPFLKHNFFMGQIGSSSISNTFDMIYDIDFAIDEEKAKEDHNIDVDDFKSNASVTYTETAANSFGSNLLWSVGYLRETSVGEFAVFYTDTDNGLPVITAKIGIKIL